MTEGRPTDLLDVDGPAAPPRRNGELVFDAPWQSRLFGLTLSLQRAGHFAWEEFRERLIAEIDAWQRAHPTGEGWSYYECWRLALESLLAAKGVCGAKELSSRTAELAARPPGHDH